MSSGRTKGMHKWSHKQEEKGNVRLWAAKQMGRKEENGGKLTKWCSLSYWGRWSALCFRALLRSIVRTPVRSWDYAKFCKFMGLHSPLDLRPLDEAYSVPGDQVPLLFLWITYRTMPVGLKYLFLLFFEATSLLYVKINKRHSYTN